MPSRAGVARAGSLRALIDGRESADHTLVRIELPAETEPPPSEALRAAADPDEPIGVGPSVAQLVPPTDATNRFRTLRIPMLVAIALAVAGGFSIVGVGPAAGIPDAVQDTLGAIPGMPWTYWIGAAAFGLANLVMIPLELVAIVAGVLFGALRGGLVALLGSLVAAAIGYVAGRAIGVGRARTLDEPAIVPIRAAAGRARRDRCGGAATGVGGQRRIDSSALRCGAGSVPDLHGGHCDRPGCGDRRAQRSGRPASSQRCSIPRLSNAADRPSARPCCSSRLPPGSERSC